MQDQLDSCLLLVNRLAPKNVGENVLLLAGLLENEEDAEEFISSVDVPFIRLNLNKSFLCSQYNLVHLPDVDCNQVYRQGSGSEALFDSEGQPVNEPSDAKTLPEWLLKLECGISDAMNSYFTLYYPSSDSNDNSCTSTHLWTLDDIGNWAGCVGFQNLSLAEKQNTKWGVRALSAKWNSSHLFSVSRQSQKYNYKLTSTILLVVEESSKSPVSGNSSKFMSWSTSLTRQTEILGSSRHITNLGKLIESAERYLRAQASGIHLGKTGDVSLSIRNPVESGKDESHDFNKSIFGNHGRTLMSELNSKFLSQ